MAFPEVITRRVDASQVSQYRPKYRTFYAGFFERGPLNTLTSVYNQVDFKYRFGKPNINNIEEWMMIYNFFEYRNDEIIISRVVSENSRNAYFTFPESKVELNISNQEEFNNFGNENSLLTVVARNPGAWANGIKIAIFDSSVVNNNELIYSNYYAKDFVRSLANNQKYLVVFENSEPNEQLLITDNNFDYLNEFSEYIFIESKLKNQTFYGDNIINLSKGYSNAPTQAQITEIYESLGDSNDLDAKFILANPYAKNASIQLADTRQDCVAFVGIKGESEINSLTKSENAVVYIGEKIQKNIYTGKNVYVPFIGDVLGLRSYICNNQGIEISHCKSVNNLLNTEGVKKIYNDSEARELYDSNINIIKRGYNGFYPYSENTLKGTKLTDILIIQDLTKECESISNYYIFEQNDEFTRNDLRSKIIAILERYVANRLIQEYQVICDLTNNEQGANTINISVFYKPQFLIEVIRLNLVSVNNL